MLVEAVFAVLIAILIRDIFYRVFFVYPRTDFTGRWAATIEDRHIFRWLAPVAAGMHGKTNIFFAGNSHVMDGVDPAIVTNRTGLSAYNLALYYRSPLNAVEVALKSKNYPQLMFIDFSVQYSIFKSDEKIQEYSEKAMGMPALARVLHQWADRFQSIAPSMFAPVGYRSVLVRMAKKIVRLISTKRMSFGRYSPFKPFQNYEWWLDKETNHRKTVKSGEKSKWQKRQEDYLIERTLRLFASLAKKPGQDYYSGLRKVRAMIQHLTTQGVDVVLMRMPLSDEVAEAENQFCRSYVDDFATIATDLGLDFWDFNSPEHRELLGHLEYYSDGQHLFDHSAQKLSEHLSTMISERVSDDVIPGASSRETPLSSR